MARITLLACVLILFSGSAALAVDLFQPDSATASSEFSGSYDIGNAIDGSGLPANFQPTDAHDNYAINNHWTTQSNRVPGATATFSFDEDTTIGTFYLWNHRSNGIAANPFYEVTLFDLTLLDAGNSVLLSLEDLTAMGETATAQAYSFLPVDGVRSVVFEINENQGYVEGIGTNYTGVAEVAFSAEGIPEPTSLALCGLLVGGLALARRLRS